MICVAGKNQITIDAIEFISKFVPADEICVIPNTTDLGLNNWQPSIIKYSKLKGITLCQPENLYNQAELILFSFEFDRILKIEKFKSDQLFNVHFSDLPKYKGQFTSTFPILNHERTSGVTLHKIDRGVDTGDIIDKIIFSIDPNDTCRDLYLNYMKFGIELFKKNFQNLINKNYQCVPQSSEYSSFYSINSIDYKDVKIDLRQTAYHIKAQIRAFTFREYQLPVINGNKIYKAEISRLKSKKKIGVVNVENFEFLEISTVDYDVKLYKDHFDNAVLYLKTQDFEQFIRCVDSLENIDLKTPQGWTLLMIASFHGLYNYCEYLIHKGANINATGFNGTTVLMYAKSSAVKTGKMDVLELLLNNAANIQLQDENGLSIIDYAHANNEITILEFIHLWNQNHL